MATEQRSYIGLPQVAIAADAVTPDPGVAGVWVYSTTETAPLCWNGTAWKLQPAGQTINDQTELVGTDPAADFLLIWDTSAAATKKVKPNNLGLAGGGVDALVAQNFF